MAPKTVMIVDDEQEFLDALADALDFNGYRVLRCSSVADAMHTLSAEPVNLVSVDIMLTPGDAYAGRFGSERAGLHLIQMIRKRYPKIRLFALSVVTDPSLITEIQSYGAAFFKKGEAPLRTYLERIDKALSGVAPATSVPKRKWR